MVSWFGVFSEKQRVGCGWGRGFVCPSSAWVSVVLMGSLEKGKWYAVHQIDACGVWDYQDPWNFSASRLNLTMTGEFEDFTSEIVAWLAEHLIPFVQQAVAAETLIHVFERGLFNGLLAVGGNVRDTLLQSHEGGDQGDVIIHHDQPLDCSATTVGRSL